LYNTAQLPNSLQIQRGFQEGPMLNNDIFGSNGTHIHSLTDSPVIRDVWEDNFEQEIKTIMHLAEKYKVVSMVINSRYFIEICKGYRIPRYCIQA